MFAKKKTKKTSSKWRTMSGFQALNVNAELLPDVLLFLLCVCHSDGAFTGHIRKDLKYPESDFTNRTQCKTEYK